VTLHAVPPAGYTFQQWFGDCSGSADSATVTINSLKTCTALFEPVNQPAFVLKKARLKIRIDGKVNKDSLVIAIQNADMLQDAVEELVNGGSFTAGFYDDRSVVTAAIDGDRFVKRSGGLLHFQQLSDQANVRILINPNQRSIRITVNHFTALFHDYTPYPVAAFIDIGSFRYDIDRHDVDGQWKVSKTTLTFTVKNVQGNL
jgi:hypothetical protein